MPWKESTWLSPPRRPRVRTLPDSTFFYRHHNSRVLLLDERVPRTTRTNQTNQHGGLSSSVIDNSYKQQIVTSIPSEYSNPKKNHAPTPNGRPLLLEGKKTRPSTLNKTGFQTNHSS
jgi:hypothetical protein